MLSRQTIERRVGISNETERKKLTRKLNSMIKKDILVRVDASNGGVWYVFAAIAYKFPHAIEMARKAESLGDVGVILIVPETPETPLLFLRQSDPEEGKRPGRPAQ